MKPAEQDLRVSVRSHNHQQVKMSLNIASIGVKIVLGVSSALLASLLIYLYRTTILSRIKRTIHFIFDTTAEIQLTRVDKYSSPAQNQIDHDLFKHIQEDIEGLTLSGISNNRLRVEMEDLATALVVTIEADPKPTYKPNSQSGNTREKQKVVVKTDPTMRFGYRSYDDLDEFRKVSQKISDQISSYCFDDERPSESFVLGELETRVPAKVENIDDENLGLHAEFEDSKMVFNFEEPDNLTRGVRTYFQPLKSYS